MQARLYVVRAGDAEHRKSAGCAVSPVRADSIASLHHLEALFRAADAPYTAAPRFSTRPSMSAGASVTLQNFSSSHDPRVSCRMLGSSAILRNSGPSNCIGLGSIRLFHKFVPPFTVLICNIPE